MRVISRRRLREFWERRPDAEGLLRAWFAEAKNAEWHAPTDVTARYASASILKAGRVVFNIGGNKYRLVVKINYDFGIIYVRFIGTHDEYNAIDAEEV